MSLLSELVRSIEPCGLSEECKHSLDNVGAEHAQCRNCRFAPGRPGNSNWWSPADGIKRKHPGEIAEKKEARIEKRNLRYQQRLSRSKPKQRLLHKAALAEKNTERAIIHSTVNSGRAHMDGDHVHAGRITLDTKLQTGRINPVVQLDQLDKVRMDARRGGNPIGALVLQNKVGRQVVVLDIADYVRLVGNSQ